MSFTIKAVDKFKNVLDNHSHVDFYSSNNPNRKLQATNELLTMTQKFLEERKIAYSNLHILGNNIIFKGKNPEQFDITINE